MKKALVVLIALMGTSAVAIAQDGEPAPGTAKWQYQSEESSSKTYVPPTYHPSLPIEVEQLRRRVSSLEDRTERLEKALKAAIEVINQQTDSIKVLSGS